MASPGDKKGQCRGSCGHTMTSFDNHKKCARCREKRIGDDPCVNDEACEICDSFTETQKDMLATPTYHIRKDKKSGILVSPEVTVIASVEETNKNLEPSFQSPPHNAASAPSDASSSFVTSDQLKQITDQWAEQFAHFEALLSSGNVFTPKTSVKPMPPHTVVSDSPFIAPSAWLTGSGGCPGRG